jgi:hypothetical protein
MPLGTWERLQGMLRTGTPYRQPHSSAESIATLLADIASQHDPDVCLTSAPGPSVWTGRALQAENDDLEKVGLALLYPAY